MVGVWNKLGKKQKSVLASVTLVDINGKILYHKYIKLPKWAVKVDYRTNVSGITKSKLQQSNGAEENLKQSITYHN